VQPVSGGLRSHFCNVITGAKLLPEQINGGKALQIEKQGNIYWYWRFGKNRHAAFSRGLL
jgi:hypothetical protein